ncbi:MAG: class III cytochrome C family protein [Pseudomonadota bacterium]
MKRKWLLVLIALNLVVLVGLAFIYPHLMVAPGALSPAHAGLSTDCFACHAPLRGVSEQRCTTCHAIADIGLRTSKGAAIARAVPKAPFHQQLVQQDCIACHSDHAGPMLTHRTRKPFSHELLIATARDRCESCHKPPKDNLHRQTQGSCAQCHKASAWKPATIEHDKLFLLDGDHNAPCATCHKASDFKTYTCYGCHEHTPANIRRKHEKEGVRDFDNCVECHRSADEEPERRGARGQAQGGRHNKD